MQYEERRPPAHLAHWIDCVWTLRGAGGGPDPVLPDGRTEIILNFGDAFRRHVDGAVERQANALFAGPARHAVVLEPTGRIDILGIRLKPAAATAGLAIPSAELQDCIPALEDVAPRLAMLRERAGNAADPAAAAVTLIEPLLRSAEPPDRRVLHALEIIEHARGGASVDRAARAIGWSARQLQRRFLHDVGLGPKTFARIVRVQAAARAAGAVPEPGWARIAAACGFFDQAHLIREFRTIADRTPAAFFRSSPLGTLFAGG